MKKNIYRLSLFALALFLGGCATMSGYYRTLPSPDDSLFGQGPGRTVLSVAKKMVYLERKIVKGSCWDWVDAVFNRAGYPVKKRSTVFKGDEGGPYADVSVLRPGDWVMHYNLEYPPYTHSSIFVRWLDRKALVAEAFDYSGQDKEVPGKLAKHCYAKAFGILRASEK